jgi:hypothetical protein
MHRVPRVLLLAAAAVACRPYDNYSTVANQDGLIPAAQYARYGRQQAELVAIGRSLAAWRMGSGAEDLAMQVSRAACFARRFPDVTSVDPDPQGHRLTVQFNNGWRTAVVPIPDGVAPEETPGLPPLGPNPPSCW